MSNDVRKEPVAQRKQYFYQHTKQVAAEFCETTPIHGISHLIGRNKLLVERIWWILLFVLSLYFCLIYMYSIVEKWLDNPIIVSFDRDHSSIYSVPFPAVTICPETKVKASVLNVSHTFQLVRSGKLNESMDGERVRKLLALLQLCEHDLYDRSETATEDNDMLKLLRKMAIPSFEIFQSCFWKGHPVECLDVFKTSLTEKGFCYSFNTIANNDLLRNEELDPSYAFNSEKRASHWNLDFGYQTGVGINAFPHRVITGGYLGSLAVSLLVNKSDVDYFCGNSFQGFKVILHMPNEHPQLMHQFFRIPLNKELIVTVVPHVTSIGPRAQQYRPEQRHCFNSRERHLRFFQIYTQKNCEIECLTNYTLKLCGCVRFWMPRSPGAPICALRDSPCCRKALSLVHKLQAKAEEAEDSDLPKQFCNCLPTCNNIEYHWQVSQAAWDWQNDRLVAVSPVLENKPTLFRSNETK
ncbi:pickpocket protein 28-like isoform X2 [Sabethes cyaneus]|uniref:pickpocket protein 28-like isoform X2 n=1 Tax=Sabethes cyaneus TaxID=53552 RepID=UPI00237E5E42|nr:pickpocket protein 28-like isoform X2 [Sabethes cyaneus]